jgi:ribose transport system substrate-binding protein
VSSVRAALVVSAVLALGVAGCGGDDSANEPTSGAAAEATPHASAISPEQVQAKCPSPDAETAKAEVDTSKFKQKEPWTLGISAGYLSRTAWIAYFLQEIKHAASEEPRYANTIVTDAGFNASKQVSDIKDLITKKVNGIIYWPVDQAALKGVLAEAEAAGIPTVESAIGFTDLGTSSVDIDYYAHAVVANSHLMVELGGKGKVLQMLPSAGSLAAVQEAAALKCVLESFPDVELLDSQHGNFNAPDSKAVAESWVQKYPEADAIVSMWAEQSRGIAEAFDEGGRLEDLKFAPANELNGWMKFLADHPEQNAGIVTAPVSLGGMAVEQLTKILDGEPVTKGVFVGNEYVAPDSVADIVAGDKPESYWPNDMPEEFQP